MQRIERWAWEHDQCRGCGTSEKPHLAKGLCATCYHKQYERKAPARSTGELERFVAALPGLLSKSFGVYGISAAVKDGQVTFKKMGTSIKATWPDD